MADWHIELLAADHERGAFSCGNPPLDDFIRKHARQYVRRDIGQTYVAVRPGNRSVIGYYTLAASSIKFEHIPKTLARRLPKHPVSTVLLGRLAVDTTAHGIGLGRDLLADALRRVLRLADAVGVFGIHTHTTDDARSFYEHFGFQSLLDQPTHMLLPMATIRESMDADTQESRGK
jgi:GNAT superfamily N-acetyltransferase